VVRWLGAVQAQDYFGALWAVGLRLQNATEADVEQAITAKAIVRTWPMRGTLHFPASQDAVIRGVSRASIERARQRRKTLRQVSSDACFLYAIRRAILVQAWPAH
jgi:hypothetical protein